MGKKTGGGPCVFYAVAKAIKKNEDFFLAVPSQRNVTPPFFHLFQSWPEGKQGKGAYDAYGLYAIIDGHNGRMAGEFVSSVIADVFHELLSRELNKDLPAEVAIGQALCETFIVLDARCIERYTFSGCTLSLLIQHGWDIHVGSVGDSRALLFDGTATHQLTYDFRVEDSAPERERIQSTGATVHRLACHGRGPVEGNEAGCGPMRVWPGGLCLSRAIGDPDVGACILPHPFYKHVRVPSTPARVILATDGVWDAVPNQAAIAALRGCNTEAACTELVDVALARRGLRDDTTVIVVDLTPNGENVAEAWGGAGQTAGLCGLCGPALPKFTPAGKGVEEVAEMDFFTTSPVVSAKLNELLREGSAAALQRQGVVGMPTTTKAGSYKAAADGPVPPMAAGAAVVATAVIVVSVPATTMEMTASTQGLEEAAVGTQTGRGTVHIVHPESPSAMGSQSDDEDVTVRAGHWNGPTAAQLLLAAGSGGGGAAALAAVEVAPAPAADSAQSSSQRNIGAGSTASLDKGSFAVRTLEGSVKGISAVAELVAASRSS